MAKAANKSFLKISTESTDASHPIECVCAICANRNEFDFGPDLQTSLLEGKIAIFAGAGISTEGSNIVGHSFYDELKHELGLKENNLEFPDIVSKLCSRPNGRLKFIELISARFLSIRSTPEFYWMSTQFHRTLAPISIIDTIITTNWDDFFERECWATPFVFSEDTAFWAATDRKVLKIHGTIENLGSIVASKEDYDKCKDRLSKDLIGSRLKIILSEKTVIFCGYSLKDFDFQEIMKFVHFEMNGFHRQSYIVTLDRSNEAKQRFSEFGIIPIYTDGTFFLETIHQKWCSQTCAAPPELYDEAENLLNIVRDEHIALADKFNMFDDPVILFSLFYQDGLIHVLQRIVLLRKSGEYSNVRKTSQKVQTYTIIKKKAIKLRRYDDAAYIEGYLSGLMFACEFPKNPDTFPPLYFMFNDKYAWNIDDFEIMMKDSTQKHTASLKRATNIVAKYKRTNGFVLDHQCRLDGIL